VAYADVFDYPLTSREIHRFLIGVRAPIEMVDMVLNTGEVVPKFLMQRQGYITLPDRMEIIETRQQRAANAARLWPRATYYGRLIALFPFVRMVAVTGALAMDNVNDNADLDYLVVTRPGRLWLCRALVVLLVRWAALRSEIICPNLFLSEQSLVYSRRDLYTAHEMAQMVPIAGYAVYLRMMVLNTWILDYLPNVQTALQTDVVPHHRPKSHAFLRNSAEILLGTAWVDWLERWEMNRKIRKFSLQRGSHATEADFCADWCKGYFNAHEQHTLVHYAERLAMIEDAWRSTINA
jgi:hypothetical protein